MYDKKQIAYSIRAHREDLGLSQEALAERAGVGRQSICRWESWKSNINVDAINKLCLAFKCDIGHLFGDYPDQTIDAKLSGEFLGLSPEAVSNLLKLKSDKEHSRVLDQILSAPDFVQIIDELWQSQQYGQWADKQHEERDSQNTGAMDPPLERALALERERDEAFLNAVARIKNKVLGSGVRVMGSI